MKRLIIRYKIEKRNLYRRFYQRIADGIIVKLQNCKSQEDFDHWYSLGVYVDNIARNKNIYLK